MKKNPLPNLNLFVLIVPFLLGSFTSTSLMDKTAVLKVKKCQDFKVTGDGNAVAWKATDWVELPKRSDKGPALATKLKILYSDSGMYFLFHCDDRRITATMNEDFMDLWVEDVVEVFLWPDESMPAYFEYELSPLNHELPLLISNKDGNLTRWQPFHYEADRKSQHETSVTGGVKKSQSAISSWTAEFYIPYPLLRPLNNVPPSHGTTWRANFYRVDYDEKDHIPFTWQPVTTNFHDYEHFGTLVFD